MTESWPFDRHSPWACFSLLVSANAELCGPGALSVGWTVGGLEYHIMVLWFKEGLFDPLSPAGGAVLKDYKPLKEGRALLEDMGH